MLKKGKIRNRLILHPERCKGCRYCIGVCPKEAISVTNGVNPKGYKPVQVNMDACICCGSCNIICPDYVFEIKEVG